MNYYERIETLVDGMLEDGYPDDVDEAVIETVDSSRLVMMHDQNIKVLEESDNEPEEWMHLVTDECNWRNVIQSMAFDVVRQDVYDELQQRGRL